MREFEHLLPDLEPPSGGLMRLQRSVAAGRRLRVSRQRWAWAVAVACVPIAVLAVWMPQWIAQRQQTVAFTVALRQTLSPHLPADGIVVAHGAAIELPSGQGNVKLYLVQSASSQRR